MQTAQIRGIVPGQRIIDSVLSRGGKYCASIRSNDVAILHDVDTLEKLEGYDIAATGGLSFRTFRRQDGRQGTELLFIRQGVNGILRWDIEQNCSCPTLAPALNSSALALMEESSDGRYFALVSKTGRLQVWNFDTPEPQQITCLDLPVRGTPSSVSFNHSNTLLCLTTLGGSIHLVDVWKGMQMDLNRQDRRWPCYTAAWHPECNGLVFGGNSRYLWMLNIPTERGVRFHWQNVPLDMPAARRINSNGFVEGTGCRDPYLTCFEVTVGSYVSKVIFADSRTIAVRGEKGIETWSLDHGQCICRLGHDSTIRNFDVQATDTNVVCSLE